MNKPVITYKPAYITGGLIALAGLVLAWLASRPKTPI